MNRIRQIINEELESILYDYHDRYDNIMNTIFHNFLYKNNNTYSKNIYWTVIPFNSLKRVWEDYVKYGFIRYEKFLNKIEQIMINNVIKIDIFTYLFGHTPNDPKETYEEYLGQFIDEYLNCFIIKFPNSNHSEHPNQLQFDFDGDNKLGYKQGEENRNNCNNQYNNITYLDDFIFDNDLQELPPNKLREKLMNEMIDRFTDYGTDSKSGHLFISDYGLKPLQKLSYQLMSQRKPEERLVTIDKMLNVVHIRSDLASWFVEGGSASLSNLSGYNHNDDDDELQQKIKQINR